MSGVTDRCHIKQSDRENDIGWNLRGLGNSPERNTIHKINLI